jgi:TRAP-type C4-dicarboxylate transport system permease large subunit
MPSSPRLFSNTVSLLILMLITVGMFLDGISIFLIFVPLLLLIAQFYHIGIWCGSASSLTLKVWHSAVPPLANLMVSC